MSLCYGQMLDYRGLEALYAIVKNNSFEKAAEKLHITQSAISQRLKNIQNYYGDSLLIRSHPYLTTKLGEKLLGHFMRVNQLEVSLDTELGIKESKFVITIAISRDSLETWFISLIKQSNVFKNTMLEILADDEEITLNYLKNGLVTACFSTSAKPLVNCEASYLGTLNYVLVCSPEFKQNYFGKENIRPKDLIQAPAIIFDNNDSLHDRFLRKFFNITNTESTYHIVPSVQGFKQFALKGYAYALIPEIDVISEINSGKLVNLCPKNIWEMPVYLHTWKCKYPEYDMLYNNLITSVRQQLCHSV